MNDPFKQAAANRKVLTAGEDAAGRLDSFLTEALSGEFSRNRIKSLIEQGAVSINGKLVTEPKKKVQPGDHFEIDLPEPEDPEPKGEDIPLDVLYEDDHLIVLCKPAGLVVHPGAGNWTGTLVNALIHHCGNSLSGIGGVKRPGIVHRLDKETSGVMVVAKNDAAHRHLSDQFADHGRTGPLERAYRAVVWGRPRQLKGTIDAPLGRAGDRTKRAVKREDSDDAREAITHYEVVERYLEKPDGTSLRIDGGMPPRNRSHPPDPRAHGSYRPSADRRPGRWRGLPHQGQPPAGGGKVRGQPIPPPGPACLHAAVRTSVDRRDHALRGPGA